MLHGNIWKNLGESVAFNMTMKYSIIIFVCVNLCYLPRCISWFFHNYIAMQDKLHNVLYNYVLYSSAVYKYWNVCKTFLQVHITVFRREWAHKKIRNIKRQKKLTKPLVKWTENAVSNLQWGPRVLHRSQLRWIPDQGRTGRPQAEPPGPLLLCTLCHPFSAR